MKTLLFLMLMGATCALSAITVTDDHTGYLVGSDDFSTGTPDMIWDQNGVWITHPYNAFFVDVYRLLTGAESFDFDNGGELSRGSNALNNTSYPSDPSAPAPANSWSAKFGVNHGFSALFPAVDEANEVGMSALSFNLDTTNPNDFYYDTATGIEHRFYRGGEVAFFELDGSTIPFYEASGLTLYVQIDWPAGGTSTGEMQGMFPLGNDKAFPNIELTSFTSITGNPIEVDGGAGGEDYAVYLSQAGSSATFTGTTPAVPEPAFIGLLFGLLAATAVMRRR